MTSKTKSKNINHDSKIEKSDSVKFRRMQSEFITATSHQFRTPLSTIRSSLDLLTFYIQKENTARQQEILEKLKRSVDYLTDMVEKITLIYKYDPAKQKPNIQEVDARKFVSDILEEIVLNVGETHYINTSFDEAIITLHCDEFILKQVLTNLINNAIKFSPDGGEIRLNVGANKRFIVFSVKDEGIGISKTDMKNLFTPFFRGKNSANVPGVGLGLSIVKNMCRIHKAKIECKSEPNKGTEFRILIPTKYK